MSVWAPATLHSGWRMCVFVCDPRIAVPMRMRCHFQADFRRLLCWLSGSTIMIAGFHVSVSDTYVQPSAVFADSLSGRRSGNMGTTCHPLRKSPRLNNRCPTQLLHLRSVYLAGKLSSERWFASRAKTEATHHSLCCHLFCSVVCSYTFPLF